MEILLVMGSGIHVILIFQRFDFALQIQT